MASAKALDIYKKLALKTKQVVLNLSEAAVKAQEATNNEPWGPHGQLMADIAEGSFNDDHFKEVWEVLRKRMVEGTGPKWRQTYKSLLVIEFLVKQSSQRVVQVVLENVGVIQELQKFQYKDEAGKDWGLNVRNRAKELCALLGNADRIREERAKAKANREKYRGLSRDQAAAGGSFKGAAAEGYHADHTTPSYEEASQHFGGQGGSSMLAMEEEEEEDVDPVAATARRVNSLKQAAVVAEQAPALSRPPAPARSPARPLAPPAPAADAAGFDAFPDPEEPAAAAAKPSLRALTESKKGAPKKLGDVRVDPNIARSFGGLKLSPPPASPKPAAASPKPAAATQLDFGWGADEAATQPPAAAPPAAPAPASSLPLDPFADFGGTSSASPAATLAPAPVFDDPFAVLPADRQPAPASLAAAVLGAGAGAPSQAKPASNPFAAPTISLTATAGFGTPAPLPEGMFTPQAVPTLGAFAQGGIASPTGKGVGIGSPNAMRGSALRPAATAAAPAPATANDPFSAFNPFK